MVEEHGGGDLVPHRVADAREAREVVGDRRVGGALRGAGDELGRELGVHRGVERHARDVFPTGAQHDRGGFGIEAAIELHARVVEKLQGELIHLGDRGVERGAHEDQPLRVGGEIFVEPRREREVGERPHGENRDRAGKFADLAHEKHRGRFVGWQRGRVALGQRWHDVGRVIGRAMHRHVIRPRLHPRALVDRTSGDVTITLKTNGEYQSIKRVV